MTAHLGFFKIFEMPENSANQNWNTSEGIDWPVAIFVWATPILAVVGVSVYLYFNGIHYLEPVQFAVLYFLTGLGITAGFHRYYAHRSHEAHWVVQLFYLIAGAVVLQRSAIDWARVHRIHHRYSDTDLDPHNIHKGFYYAHMGWIYQKTPLTHDYSTVPDLLNDKLALWQKKYYWLIVAVFGVGLSTLIGAMVGRPLGGFLWGFALRMVAQNQVIYGINSWTHTFGRQTYSKKFEARDSFLYALISNGEGYHSFHHRFASDYRNGWRWFDWDPSKWFIGFLSWFGLTKKLRRTPKDVILKAREESSHIETA